MLHNLPNYPSIVTQLITMSVLLYFDAIILSFCILFLLDLLNLILFNLVAVGEPFADIPEGDTIYETPAAADLGAGNVANHLADWARHSFGRLILVVDFIVVLWNVEHNNSFVQKMKDWLAPYGLIYDIWYIYVDLWLDCFCWWLLLLLLIFLYVLPLKYSLLNVLKSFKSDLTVD